MQLRFQRIRLALLSLLCAMTIPMIAHAQPAPALSAEEVAANAAIAERFCQLAQSSLMNRQIVPATLHLAAAALEAAAKLNPSEPRFLRLLTEAYLQIGGDEGRAGAINSLKRYRAIVPADQGAQVQEIDLHYSGMETADKRRGYLDYLLGVDTISTEVKSHIAVMAAKLCEERAESGAAQNYVDKALLLMPLNPEALRLKYRQIDREGTSVQRITLLFQMLRSNPAQPSAMIELASELADAGMVEPSLNWYRTGLELTQRLSMSPDLNQVTAYASELVIADQMVSAQPVLKSITDRDPSNVQAALLTILVEKRGGGAERIEPAIAAARSAMLARLSRISGSIQGKNEAPTSQPSTPADVDMAGDVKKLLELADSNATDQYASGLADLAMLEIYFNEKAADAQPYIVLLRQLVASDNVILARLEGWNYLADGKTEEARVKLSAVADRDPLAALGMFRLDKDKPASQLDATGKKLLNENASGTIGAILIEGLRNRFGLMPPGPDAAAIFAQVSAFPKEWLDILDFARVQTFYSLKAEPLRVSYDFGEPMLARVSITNVSKYDLTIGAEGVIHPDLWFDAQIKGVATQNLSGVALDRIGQKMLLHPKDSVSVVVRADQGTLGAALQGSPNLSMILYFFVLTNPVSQPTGIAPGPGGYRAQLTHTVVRNPTQMTPAAFAQLAARQQSAPADARIRIAELLGSCSLLLKSQPDPGLQAKAKELLDMLRKGASDPVPAVRAGTMYITALLSESQVKEGLIRQMLSEPSLPHRILGLAAAQQALEPAQAKQFAKELMESNPDPVVKAFAAATIEVAELPQPTTAPTSQPDAPAGAADLPPAGK